jgi:predicted Zn-dependent protease with MMP-like domain
VSLPAVKDLAVKREHFTKVVEEALDSLPQEFRSRIQNVAVLGAYPRSLSATLSTASGLLK